MDKQIVVYPYYRTLFSNKKEWNSNTWNNMNESWKNYAKWKKQTQKTTYNLCDSIYTKFWKNKTIITESRSVIVCSQQAREEIYWKEA